MKFLYLRDPLWMCCFFLYFANRWFLKPAFSGGFVHTSLNDLICIPFWVPIMLWTMRKIGLRAHDKIPQAQEILIPLLLWSWYFELWLPNFTPVKGIAHADVYDVFHYVTGAGISFLFWRHWYQRNKIRSRFN